jgi:streptogramin lyase
MSALAIAAPGCGDAGSLEAPAPALGIASFDLTVAPAEARCATIDITSTAGLVTRSFALGPGTAAVVTLDNLPVGAVTLNEKVYTVGCNELTGVTPTWIADPVKLTLVAGVPVDVTVVLRRVGAVGQVTIRTDYPTNKPVLTDYAVPLFSTPSGIAAGSDGNVWFTERDANKIARITPGGAITEFAVPTPGALPTTIAAAPDGSLWFTMAGAPKLGRITTAGSIREFAIPSGQVAIGIAAGPDGNMWFTQSKKLAYVTPTGGITELTMPGEPRFITAGPGNDTLWFTADKYIGRYSISMARLTPYRITGEDVQGIVAGPDGALWLTIPAGRIARLDTAGGNMVYTLTELGPGRTPEFLAAGADGGLWWTSSATGTIGRISVAGTLTEYLTPSDSRPTAITSGPDGALWYTDTRDRVGRVKF